MSKHNLELLVEAARLLQPLLGELVFVGGSTTALLITDKAAAEVRPTYDVDAIAEISSYALMLISRNDSAGAVFGRIPEKELRFAGGGRRRRFWTSCRSTRRSWDFPTAGTSRLWIPPSSIKWNQTCAYEL